MELIWMIVLLYKMFFFIVISDVELMMFKIKKEKEKPSCYGLTFYFEIFVAITTATCFSLKWKYISYWTLSFKSMADY